MLTQEELRARQKRMRPLLIVLFIFAGLIGLYLGYGEIKSGKYDSKTTPNTQPASNGGKTSAESVDNKIVPVVNNTTKTGAVTIDNSSCIITHNGYLGMGFGTEAFRCKQGDKFAQGYDITVSGSMTGPVGTVFYIKTDPAIPSIHGEEVFSCGGWETDKIMSRCTRQANSNIETAQWTIMEPYVVGEQINLNPDMQVTINTDVKDSMYGKLLDSATYTISCPTVNYCIK